VSADDCVANAKDRAIAEVRSFAGVMGVAFQGVR